jgi:hypothetical protein
MAGLHVRQLLVLAAQLQQQQQMVSAVLLAHQVLVLAGAGDRS